jgi:hypothetical protein
MTKQLARLDAQRERAHANVDGSHISYGDLGLVA